MTGQQILDELLALLQDNGVEVRSESLGGSGGGLCQVKGKQLYFVDTQAPCAETAGMCAEALATIVNIEKIYLRPQIRRYVEKNCKQAIKQSPFNEPEC